MESILLLVNSQDIGTLRGTAFALHSLSYNMNNHAALEKAGAIQSVIPLLQCEDHGTILQACLSVKYLSKCEACRVKFVACNGLEHLLALSVSNDLETKRELAAALRNISLSDENKTPIMDAGIDLIATLCRDPDGEVSHQACGIVANISEKQENKIHMIEKGIIHHLQAAISFSDNSIPILRETVRAYSGLSSAIENTAQMVGSGVLGSLISALNANDILCRRFAAMVLANLAINTELHERIIHETGMPLLMLIGRQGDRNFIDIKTQQHGMACLANLASCNKSHVDLMSHGGAELAVEHIKSSDLDLRCNALLLLANLASNKNNHHVLGKCIKIPVLMENLNCHNATAQLHACYCLRGLSTNISIRKQIITSGGTEILLSLVHTTDDAFKVEILSTLCNLSLGGCMGDRANTVLEKIDMQSLIAFLCNGDSTTHRMFGSVAIGNIASNMNLQAPIFDSGAVKSLIDLAQVSSGKQDEESQRCMAYAICNLSAETQNRMSIITQGGLASIMFLCHTNDTSDMLAGLSTLRGLSASDDARRMILEEGVLHALLLGLKSGNLQCKREVSSILVNLSLNEENKFDIARSDEMKELISLLDEADVHCVSNICRAIGNVCEVIELHKEILSILTAQRLVLLSSPDSGLDVNREVVRCTANLSSNFTMHDALAQSYLHENLRMLCSNIMSEVHSDGANENKMEVIRLSALTLANLCMNASNHDRLSTKDLLLLFHKIISWNCEIISESAVSQAKCIACMGLSVLCTKPNAVPDLLKLGTIPALVQCIATEIPELSVYASFVLNKLATVESTHQELGHHKVSSALVRDASSNQHSVTYSIAALRRLSSNDNVRSELIANDALDFLSNPCATEDTERSRELACCLFHLSLWEKAKMPIAENSVLLHQIITLCSSPDIETSRFALGCLANEAEDVKTHEMILQHPVVEQLVRLIQSSNIPVVRETTRALANIMSSVSTHQVFMKENGLAVLSCVCEVQDKECVHNAAVVFRKLAANDQTHAAFFAEQRIGIVMHLTTMDDKQTVLQSAATLRDISSNPELQLAFVEAGGLEAAIDLASSDADVDLNTVALGIVRHLSVPMPLKTKILQSGVVNVVSRCIENGVENNDLLYQCASSLANIAEHAQNKAALVQMGSLPCLVSLSRCECADVKLETSRALSLLSSAPENVDAFNTHVLPAVIDLLKSQDEGTVRDSASAISNVSGSAEKKLLVRTCNGIAPLVELLKSPYESVQIASCKALSRLTDIEDNKTTVHMNGGLTLLLHLCSGDNSQKLLLAASMVLVNLSSCSEHQDQFIKESALVTLKPNLGSQNPLLRQYTAMMLCNLSSHDLSIDHIARQVDLLSLIELMNDDNRETRLYVTMTICNLSSKHTHGTAILIAGGLTHLAVILNSCLDNGIQLQRAALLALYNLSTYEPSHTLLAKEEVIRPIILACRSPDVLSKRFALLIISNITCNVKTRRNATKGGGLQSVILALKDEDIPTLRFACICLANMANETNIQSQVLVHGGLPSLMHLSDIDDNGTNEYALMCLANLSANEPNHLPLIKQGALKRFVGCSSKLSVYHQLGVANLTSNPEVLSQIGRGGGIRPLLALAKSQNLHYQLTAISGLRRLALIRDNRDRLISEGVISILVTHSCKADDQELQREIASCFCNLSLTKDNRIDMTRAAIANIAALSQCSDSETIRLSIAAIANLAEDIDTHQYIHQVSALCSALTATGHADLDIRREAARAVANLLSSKEFHPEVVEHMDSILGLSEETCGECRYLAAISFRKLCVSKVSHDVLINSGLPNMLALTKVSDTMTRKHATTAVRDLSASDRNSGSVFFKHGTIAAMIEIVKGNEKELQIIAMSTLRHLSPNNLITDDFSRSVLVKCATRTISWANDDMKCQIAGLFANLSEHRECHTTMITQGVVAALGKLSHADVNEAKQVSCCLQP